MDQSDRSKIDTSNLTYHGTTFTDGRRKQESGTDTVLKRRNSIRRLDRETLNQLATTPPTSETVDVENKNPKTKQQQPTIPIVSRDALIRDAAQRELTTRQRMDALSGEQSKERNRWQNTLSPRGVDAMRFATSLAEEAIDEVRSEKLQRKTKDHPKRYGVPQQLGVTEIGGAIGVGFSGGEDKDKENSAFLMGRMVKLNDTHNQTEGLPQSVRFGAIPVPDVDPEVTTIQKQDRTEQRKRVCAAHSSTVAAIAAGGGFRGRQSVATTELPTNVATMEVSSDAYGKSSNFNEAEYSSNNMKPDQGDPLGAPTERDKPLFTELSHDHLDQRKKGAPQRKNSFSSIMNSCPGCRQERANGQ